MAAPSGATAARWVARRVDSSNAAAVCCCHAAAARRDRRITRNAIRPMTARASRSHGHHSVESSAASSGPAARPSVVGVSVAGVSVVGVSVVGVSVVGVSVVGVSVVGVSVVGVSVPPVSGGTVVDRSGSETLDGRLTSGASPSEPHAPRARHPTAIAVVISRRVRIVAPTTRTLSPYSRPGNGATPSPARRSTNGIVNLRGVHARIAHHRRAGDRRRSRVRGRRCGHLVRRSGPARGREHHRLR